MVTQGYLFNLGFRVHQIVDYWSCIAWIFRYTQWSMIGGFGQNFKLGFFGQNHLFICPVSRFGASFDFFLRNWWCYSGLKNPKKWILPSKSRTIHVNNFGDFRQSFSPNLKWCPVSTIIWQHFELRPLMGPPLQVMFFFTFLTLLNPKIVIFGHFYPICELGTPKGIPVV